MAARFISQLQFNAQLDTSVLSERLRAVHKALLENGQECDMQQLFLDEGRMLVRQCVAFTPPLGPGGRNAGAKQAGEHAIERELNSLFSEATPEFIGHIVEEHGISDIHIHRRNVDIQIDNLDQSGARMDEFHKKARGRRGKVKLLKQKIGVWHARVMVPEGTKAPFIAKVQKRVGRWRASLAVGLPRLGGKVPRWISRHFDNIGDIAILDMSKLSHPTSPSFVFGTRAPGVGEPAYDYRRSFQSAIRSRIRSLTRRGQLVMNGYAQDINARRNPRRHAKDTKSLNPVEELV